MKSAKNAGRIKRETFLGSTAQNWDAKTAETKPIERPYKNHNTTNQSSSFQESCCKPKEIQATEKKTDIIVISDTATRPLQSSISHLPESQVSPSSAVRPAPTMTQSEMLEDIYEKFQSSTSEHKTTTTSEGRENHGGASMIGARSKRCWMKIIRSFQTLPDAENVASWLSLLVKIMRMNKWTL